MSPEPVVVIGGGLAGMAAAARLAKLGHPVRLYEERDRLGGVWAAYQRHGVLVDDAPSVLGFPAPWRDLFRKSGRPLESELARSGYRLAPAPPLRVAFGDGAELELPGDRGDQWQALAARYGVPAARRWRDLLDRLDDVWQALRPLGLENDLATGRRLPRRTRARLLGSRRTVADLAAGLDHPHLSALIRSTAYRAGSAPDQTPALAAVEWSVARRFGRWQVEPDEGRSGDVGRSSVLTEALAERLRLRKVDVRLGVAVQRIVTADGRVRAVVADEATEPAAAVIATGDPWRTAGELLAGTALRQTRRRLRRLRPARAAHVEHHPADPAPRELLLLDVDGVPTTRTHRPDRGLTTVVAHAAGPPRAAYGVAWDGLRSFADRPRVRTELPGLFLAGPCSPAGAGASPEVLCGALASQACHLLLGGS